MRDWEARRQFVDCGCPARSGREKRSHWATSIHTDPQDIESDAWRSLLSAIDEAAADGRAEFDPFLELGPELWGQIVVLPKSIAKLKRVKRLVLYGSNLRSIPAEIGQMEHLEDFDPYTSHRLHWFPYELVQCSRLRDSRVSTRALYGNWKYRVTFPGLPSTIPSDSAPSSCSICARPLVETDTVHQRWISLRIATDVMPLLVHACSEHCLVKLPAPPDSYVSHAHRGGTELVQPPSG